MFYKILFALVILAEFFTVPMFLKYFWPKKCKQSLMYKMISATLFVICGILAMKISGNNTSYAVLMVWGLVFGWLGDLFLHSLKDKMLHFAIGVVAFLLGHVFYIVAFHHAVKTLNPAVRFLSWGEILTLVIGIALVVAYVVAKKFYQKKGPMVIGLIVYGAFLIAMVIKACLYLYSEWDYGISDYMVPAVFTVGVGSVFFLLSDASLGLILMSDEVKRGMRIFSIITYFIAQILLASSILFVRSQIIA